MHAVAFGVLRGAQRPPGRHVCRTIAGVRYPLPQRHFHRSTNYQAPEEPHISENEVEKVGDIENSKQISSDGGAGTPTVEKTGSTKRARGRPGSSRAKANRLKQPEGLPPVPLPEWFWNKNVKCFGDPDLGGSLAVYGSFSIDIEDKAKWDDDAKQTVQAITSCRLAPTKDAKYSLHVSVYQEIFSALRAGLVLKPPLNSNKNSAIRPVTLLQCPKDGGAFYLDSIVETISSKLEADLLRLDAQDIAQIIGPYLDENLAWNICSTSFLAYDSHRAAGKIEDYNKDQKVPDHIEIEDDDNVTIKMNNLTDLYKKFSSSMQARAGQLRTVSIDLGKGAPAFGVLRHDPDSQTTSRSGQDQWNDLKLSKALESLIFAADSKRSSNLPQIKDAAPPRSGNIRPLIIQIRDYKEMAKTAVGFELLRKFRIVVDKHWQLGHSILLVGTTSAEDFESALTRSEIQHLQSDIVEAEKRTIFVPPDRREEQDVQFESDEKARVRNINIRHVEDMISKLSEGTENSFLSLDISKDLDNASAYSAGLEDAVWAYPRVHRIALTMLGIDSSPTIMDGPKFSRALALLAASDEAKFNWGAVELKREDADVDEILNDLNVPSNSKKSINDKIKQIKKTGTVHEKRLLGGIIVPSDIHTTFSDIRAPKETVEALKTLTSLSFIRPEAFSYGVLATDKIPGILLYGPPGTGKTMLAKAVAKESGATVLEISGAEVNDMYVGEGEKNVKAIFTLAKKLSPCVVFIDEADAIFASRSGGSDRKHGTHRELINQFLREWDGMNDMSAFIMVATNRPFDLDEAVLRRLPRRLLVDLPVEKDREAILKIHLKDEVLDESVSLAELAKDTPFYSGSDLKNISVAAALACVREENEAASKHTGEEPYVYPVRRVLTKQHFTKAISEISASISEDMSTLAAIRKFDEKYGDRKGRRKKNSALGFGGTTEPEKDSEAGRVRKSIV
ncbi:hypothetical protein B7494_g2543 [Chlorociboria aeruginascens]|nr:hypothetical protein B7494_g2543 [Chlorociboria aeruginascens]